MLDLGIDICNLSLFLWEQVSSKKQQQQQQQLKYSSECELVKSK